MICQKLSKRFSNFLKPKSQWKKPLQVAITGANGNIGYAIAFRIANGEMLGPDQPIILNLIDLPQFEKGLEGVKMELNDCAFPLLQTVNVSTKVQEGFKDVNYALLVGAKPRGPGMERADLLTENGKIFIDQGKALGDHASRDCKVLVVGNPANTNCMIAQHYAKGLPKENFAAMTRLDHNRSLYALADKLNCHVDDIENFCIWGNHSPTMFPDTFNGTINNKKFHDKLEQNWRTKQFIPEVQQRGAAIIKQRGLSSAASAGNAAIEHMRDWHTGTNGKWTSMGVLSNGEYGIENNIIYSFPVIVENQKYKIVENVPIGEEQRNMMKITEAELLKEKELINHLLKQ